MTKKRGSLRAPNSGFATAVPRPPTTSPPRPRQSSRIAAERPHLVVPAAPDAAAALSAHYRSADLGHIDVVRGSDGVVFDFGAFKSHVASRKNDDGTISFVTVDPGDAGFEFVLGTGATKTLTIRDGQHVYVYQPVT